MQSEELLIGIGSICFMGGFLLGALITMVISCVSLKKYSKTNFK